MKDCFIIRAIGESGENEYIITIGEHLATKKRYKTRDAAQREINKVPWDLVTALYCAIKEGEKLMNNELTKTEEK